jgi:hypothetical protein
MAGYSGTPLVKKLGLTEGLVIFVDSPPTAYFDWITPLPTTLVVKEKLSGEFDFIHLFVHERKAFIKAFLRGKRHLRKSGMLWVSWPKKSSKVPTDLDEKIIRDFGLSAGLVDVKVCAVDHVWAGLKFVFRMKDR